MLVTIETSAGNITLELFDKEAPKTVANFLSYIDSGFYNGTIFHRVINNFMIQGGGFDRKMNQKQTLAPIENEASNKLANKKGTIAMARTSDPHSATAQFFINLVDNDFLNFSAPNPRGYGYCVFGQVTAGIDIVEKIGSVKTGTVGYFSDVPRETVEIISIKRAE